MVSNARGVFIKQGGYEASDNYDLNLLSLGKLVLAAPYVCFMQKGIKFNKGLTWVTWFLLAI